MPNKHYQITEDNKILNNYNNTSFHKEVKSDEYLQHQKIAQYEKIA